MTFGGLRGPFLVPLILAFISVSILIFKLWQVEFVKLTNHGRYDVLYRRVVSFPVSHRSSSKSMFSFGDPFVHELEVYRKSIRVLRILEHSLCNLVDSCWKFFHSFVGKMKSIGMVPLFGLVAEPSIPFQNLRRFFAVPRSVTADFLKKYTCYKLVITIYYKL